MYVHQRKYVMDVLQDTGMLDAKMASTPMPKDHKFSYESPLLPDPDRYRRLLYVTMTRPDIMYVVVVQQLSQHVAY